MNFERQAVGWAGSIGVVPKSLVCHTIGTGLVRIGRGGIWAWQVQSKGVIFEPRRAIDESDLS